jgi:hypothetical protein
MGRTWTKKSFNHALIGISFKESFARIETERGLHVCAFLRRP